jgi:S1-C subfamily serine protease
MRWLSKVRHPSSSQGAKRWRLSRMGAALVGMFMILAVPLASCTSGSSQSSAASAPTQTPTAGAAPTVPPSPAGSTGALSVPALVKQLRPAVVHILSEAATLNVFGQAVPQQGVGTGVIVDNQGHIVTNNHVIVQPGSCDQPATKIIVTTSDGKSYTAKIVGRDVPTDLAVLQIDAKGLSPATLGQSSALEVGDSVVAIGNALDLPGGPTVTEGVVSALGRSIDEQQCGVTVPGAVQTDAAINPGNSGGPLVNTQGQVIGFTTAIVGGAEGIGFAISTDTARPIINDLITQGKVQRAYLGVTVVDVTSSLAQSLNLPVDHGAGITSVQSGSPADKAGLKADDIIVKVGGQDIQTSGDLFTVLANHHAGDKVTVKFYRGSQSQTADVVLGQQPGG